MVWPAGPRRPAAPALRLLALPAVVISICKRRGCRKERQSPLSPP